MIGIDTDEGAVVSSTYFNDLLSTIVERGRAVLDRNRNRNRRPSGRNLAALAEALVSGQGEASGIALAQEILDGYGELDWAGRTSFFRALAERFGAPKDELEEAARSFLEKGDEAAAMRLHQASEPRRQELIRRLNRAPGGTAALVAMREDLIARLGDHPDFAQVDRDFEHLLSAWFNRGFLVLRRIDWSTPAVVLEKIIRYEAVHEINGWDDLRRRIDPSDRRLYAFFHPALVDEPLIFVEVALITEIPGAIAPILAEDREPMDPARATTAVFYSISNCQTGLRGISFGNFLIKQVVEELARSFPALRTFVTLSPAPHFGAWLEADRNAEAPEAVSDADRELLARLEDDGWHEDADTVRAVQPVVLALAAHYFLRAKTARGYPPDPVARFHLGNGARLEQLNFLGNVSPRALAESHGLMVNYLYDPKQIERYHEAYANDGEVAVSPAVRRLLRRSSETRQLVTTHER
jgi:malonyl-CoA decarboxylase